MTSPDLPALPPEIAALLDEYRAAVAHTTRWEYVAQTRRRCPELPEANAAEAAARAALESALAPLVRDAALGKALRQEVLDADAHRWECKHPAFVQHGKARWEKVMAAARIPEEADHA